MNEFDKNGDEIYDEMPFKPEINSVPDKNKHATKVCAQCKYFYVPINKTALDAVGKRSDEIRLCYEIHWCNAASPVCDDDFEPLAGGADVKIEQHSSMSLKQVANYYGELLRSPKPQKEIQYVYIGLLQQSPGGKLVEVPTKIDGVATNYRRVEMGPLDWDLFHTCSDGFRDTIFIPNTATNAVEIRFPDPQTNWKSLTHFGVYDSLVGGKLIKTKDIKPYPTDWVAGCWAWYGAGDLELQLDVLTNEKKGGE